MKTLLRCSLLVAAMVVTGCGTYRQDYAYDPAPALSGQAPPRILSAVYGILRGDDQHPSGVDLRVRLEAGTKTAEVVRDELELLSADLVPLELVRVEPEGGMVAPAGGAATWRLVYAFPPGRDVGSLDLSGLVFTWRYRVGSTTYGGTEAFTKIVEPVWVAPVYYGPWWHGPWGYGRAGWYWY